MSSQKNKAMNKSIMRYAPKDRTYARSMSLTSRINMAIGINCMGHGKYYERLFANMRFRPTEPHLLWIAPDVAQKRVWKDLHRASESQEEVSTGRKNKTDEWRVQNRSR
jgi:hypothetical protein